MSDFVDALIREDIDALKKVPKTDFHSHSALGTRIENIEKWLNITLQRPPSRMDGLDGMMSYVREILNPYINTQEGFEFTAEYAVKDAIEDHVEILEMSFGTRFALFYPNQEQGMMAFVEALSEKYEAEITLRPELGFIREDYGNKELCSVEQKCIEGGVFHSIDLYSNETACTPETFRDLFRQARANGMKLKAHVGEFGSAETVRHTVETLELDEVQHGIGAADSPEIMVWLSQNQIRLNVCPTSNVILGAVESLSRHPVRKLYDHGVKVTINTDDLMIFGQSISQEYLNLYRARIFSAEELDGIRETALEEGLHLYNREKGSGGI